MSSSTEKPFDLATSGALVSVKLWVPRELKSTVEPIETLAEIDTALARTVIQEGVATSLGLEPIGITKIRTATRPEYKAHVFRIRIVFPERNMAFEVEAVEVPYLIRPKVRIKCLIGRDILKHSVLTYNGQKNMFSLSFEG
jgi:predicted aspartyl protease